MSRGRPLKGYKPMTPAEKMRAKRERDEVLGITQMNVVIPNTEAAKAAIKDLALKLRREMPSPPPEDLII